MILRHRSGNTLYYIYYICVHLIVWPMYVSSQCFVVTFPFMPFISRVHSEQIIISRHMPELTTAEVDQSTHPKESTGLYLGTIIISQVLDLVNDLIGQLARGQRNTIATIQCFRSEVLSCT